MSTDRPANHTSGQSIWVVPCTALVIGIAYLIAGIAGGNVSFGVNGLAIMTVTAVILLVARRRSETVQGVLDRRDERINEIDLRATAFAGGVVVFVVIGAFVVDIARGGDGMPYAWLGAVGGIAYIASVVYHRLRG